MGCWEVIAEFIWSNNQRVEIVYQRIGKKLEIKNKRQLSKAIFPAKYGSLALYDEDLNKIFIIEHEILEFNKTDVWLLIGIPKKEDGTFSDQEYFWIHDDIFDRMQLTHQDRNILRKFISNEPNEN